MGERKLVLFERAIWGLGLRWDVKLWTSYQRKIRKCPWLQESIGNKSVSLKLQNKKLSFVRYLDKVLLEQRREKITQNKFKKTSQGN
jgi:hypothetical protein